MPHCYDVKEFASNSVVNKVSYSAEIQPADDFGARGLHSRSDAGLFNQQGKGGHEVNSNSSRRGRPVLRPPLRCFLYLALSARLDSDSERQRSAESLEADEQLFGRYAFLEVGFIKSFEKLSLVSGQKANDLFMVMGQNRNDSALWQGQTFDNDLAIDNGASSELHQAMVLQCDTVRD